MFRRTFLTLPRLTPPVLASPESPNVADAKRTNQEVVSAAILLHSPESSAALMPPTLADPLPAYALPRSSQELEARLHRKPPDHGEGSTWLTYHAVNDRTQPSIIKRLPPPGAASMLSITTFSPAYITQAAPLRHMSIEVIWQTRCRLPNVMDTVQQLSAGANNAGHSPLYGVVLMLPVFLRTSSARVNNPCRLNDELVSRVRKPPDVTERWLLDEAVNKTGNRGIRGSSPVPRPELAPLACSHSLWPASTRSAAVVSLLAPLVQVTEPCHWKDKLAWRVLKLPEVTKHWLLEEAINKTMKEGRWERLPAAGPTSTLYACSPLLCPTTASFTRCYSHAALASLVGRRLLMAPIVLHANRKG